MSYLPFFVPEKECASPAIFPYFCILQNKYYLMSSSDDRIRRRIRLPLIITGAIMTLFYLGMGGYIILNRGFLPKIPDQFRTFFGSLLVIYGVYRSWRLYEDHIRNKGE